MRGLVFSMDLDSYDVIAWIHIEVQDCFARQKIVGFICFEIPRSVESPFQPELH
jgi:hypothetical protein